MADLRSALTGRQVPVQRQFQPVQTPQYRGTAELILGFSELDEQARGRQQRDRFQAAQSIEDAVKLVMDLAFRKREQDLNHAKDDATIELLRAREAREAALTQRISTLLPAEKAATEALAAQRERPAPEQVFFDPETGQRLVLPKGAKPLTAPGASKARENAANLRSAISTLDEYISVVDRLPSGRIVGTGSKIISRATGLMPEFDKARRLRNLLIPMSARLGGSEVGNLAAGEQERMIEVLEAEGATKAERENLRILKSLLNKKLAEAESRSTPGVLKSSEVLRRSARPKGEKDYKTFISTDGGKSWRPE